MAFSTLGTTYFFKGRHFYQFDDLRMKVTKKSPLLSAPYWFNCPNSLQTPHYSKAQVKSVMSRAHPISTRPLTWQIILVAVSLIYPPFLHKRLIPLLH